MHAVYFLTHRLTGQRLKWYHTLAGARIAQRSGNHRLGFLRRESRITEDSREYEKCIMPDLTVDIATWIIEEDTVDSVDLLYES
jgi:hypothetical protein